MNRPPGLSRSDYSPVPGDSRSSSPRRPANAASRSCASRCRDGRSRASRHSATSSTGSGDSRSGFVIRTFRRGGVSRWTMAGKFHKHWLYRPWRWLHFLPDWRMLRFYYSRRRRANNDDSLMLGLIDEFRAAGLDCVSALDLCPELLVREGVLTRRKPTASEQKTSRWAGHLPAKWAGSTSARA